MASKIFSRRKCLDVVFVKSVSLRCARVFDRAYSSVS